MNTDEWCELQSTINLIDFYRDKLIRIHNGEGYSKVMPRKSLRERMADNGIITREINGEPGYNACLTALTKEVLGVEG